MARNKELLRIYKNSRWTRIRDEQLKADHYECQRCKHKGKYRNLDGCVRYSPAVLIHHDFRVEQYPEYAYQRFVGGKRNLYSLCQSCHEAEHEAERGMVKSVDELNEERW